MGSAGTSAERWRALYEEGRRAHAGVELAFEAFAAHVEALELDPVAVTGRGGNLLLAAACLAGETRALATFERDFVAPARGAVMRVQSSAELVEDALQELRRKLLVGPPPRLAGYLARGPLAAWVKVAASRTALDLVKTPVADAPGPRRDAEVIDALAAQSLDPGVRLLRETYREAFQTALCEVVAALGTRERNLLRFQVLEGLSIDEIAAPYGVHRATVARWLNAIHDDILTGLFKRLRAHDPRLSNSELESLGRAVRSELHLSLWRVLGPSFPGAGP